MTTRDDSQRIVVTGMGVASSLGNDVPTFWKSLKEGCSGLDRISLFDPTDYTCQVASEVRDLDLDRYLDPKVAKRNDRFTHFGVAAARQAVEDAGLDLNVTDPWRVGVLVGTGIGGVDVFEKQAQRLFTMGPRKVSPFTVPSYITNIATGVIAIELGARGPNFTIASACATATNCFGEAARILVTGDADVMVCGGTEAGITPLGFAGFTAMKAMSTGYNETPTRASRPFDKGRDGFIMGEGAGVLILETLAHAKKRGATVLGELVGYATTCDAYHITAPDPEGEGLVRCLQQALAKAGLNPDEVDYINAHGTSTPYNDKTETLAIKRVFGDHARQVAISSTKSMTGHLLGAAGGIEAIACLKAIHEGVIPPTINLEDPDPECDLDYTANVARERTVGIAASTNLGFGGHNAAIIFRAFQG